MIWLLPAPLPLLLRTYLSRLPLSQVELTDERGGEVEPNHPTARKPGLSTNHSILSGTQALWGQPALPYLGPHLCCMGPDTRHTRGVSRLSRLTERIENRLNRAYTAGKIYN